MKKKLLVGVIKMKVKELIKELQQYDENLEIFTKKEELVGNIGEINKVQADEYAFFGKLFPCIILSDK
jgi:hypothetical protein